MTLGTRQLPWYLKNNHSNAQDAIEYEYVRKLGREVLLNCGGPGGGVAAQIDGYKLYWDLSSHLRQSAWIESILANNACDYCTSDEDQLSSVTQSSS